MLGTLRPCQRTRPSNTAAALPCRPCTLHTAEGRLPGPVSGCRLVCFAHTARLPARPTSSPQVNKGKLWDTSQVDEGLPEIWVDLNK